MKKSKKLLKYKYCIEKKKKNVLQRYQILQYEASEDKDVQDFYFCSSSNDLQRSYLRDLLSVGRKKESL